MALNKRTGSPRAAKVVALLATAGLALAACSTGADDSIESSESLEHVEGQENQEDSKLGDPARPIKSAKQKTDLPGTVQQGQAEDSPIDTAYISLDKKQPKVAVLTKGKLRTGEIKQLAQTSTSQSGHSADVDDSCRTATASAKGVVVACDGEVQEFDGDAKLIQKIDLPDNVSTATITEDGVLVAGFQGTDRLKFYSMSGDGDHRQTNEDDSLIVTRSIDDFVHLRNADNEEQLAIIDRGQTSITGLNIHERDLNGALRIGQGVGQASSGRGNQGIVIASDVRQDQFQMFTLNEVIRQEQAAPTNKGPWSVLWDAKHELAWVSTTTDNKVTGFRINEGTPIKVAEFDSIANVRQIIDSPDGGFLLLSSEGDSQYLDKAAVGKIIHKGVKDTEDYPVLHQDH